MIYTTSSTTTSSINSGGCCKKLSQPGTQHTTSTAGLLLAASSYELYQHVLSSMRNAGTSFNTSSKMAANSSGDNFMKPGEPCTDLEARRLHVPSILMKNAMQCTACSVASTMSLQLPMDWRGLLNYPMTKQVFTVNDHTI